CVCHSAWAYFDFW
nr:immunoglobulin heavy chain junction region [Macaca mulatta]